MIDTAQSDQTIAHHPAKLRNLGPGRQTRSNIKAVNDLTLAGATSLGEPYPVSSPAAERHALVHRGRWFSAASLAYNTMEGALALVSESAQASVCTYLSAILLGGLLLNAIVGWWWSDPLAAMLMVPIIAHEGIEGLRDEPSCADCCD